MPGIGTLLAPLEILGTSAKQAISDRTILTPFSRVTLSDPNVGQTETLSVTLSTPINGTLSNLGGGSYNTATGVFTDMGSTAAVTAALDGLVFTPTAHQALPGQTVTTKFAITMTDSAGLSATDGNTSIVTTETSQPTPGLLAGLTAGQQLELIYVAYFNRAADSGGEAFWSGQNAQAQAAGQSAAATLTDIANSFEPQLETIALYPFLGAANLNLSTPAAQTGLLAFIANVYGNLFGHAADADGDAYWFGQITSGAVGVGAAALAIVNGATGTDAIEVQNKIAVALDFTTRTGSAGLGQAASLPTSFLAAARSALTGVDGTSLNDGSVTDGISATTTYIAAATQQIVAHASLSVGSVEPNVITVTGTNQLIDPGMGNATIQFLPGASGDLVLHAGGVDQVSDFDPGADALDFRALFSGAKIDLNGDIAALAQYVSITDQGNDAVVSFDPFLPGGGLVAVLRGLGDPATNLASLVSQGAIRVA